MRRLPIAGLTLFLALAFGPVGCGFVLTEQPLYQDRDTSFDPQLLGIWVGRTDPDPNSPPEVLVIARGDGRRYRIACADSAATAARSDTIETDLVRIGKYAYLFPHVPDFNGTVLSSACRVQVSGREMRLSTLSSWTLPAELNQHPGTLTYREVPVTQPATLAAVASATTEPADRQPATSQPTTQPKWVNYVLTDSPERIRAELIRHEDDPKWFINVAVFRRVTPSPRG